MELTKKKLHLGTSIAAAVLTIILGIANASNTISSLESSFRYMEDSSQMLLSFYQFNANLPTILFSILMIVMLFRRKIDPIFGVVLLLSPCYNLLVRLPIEELLIKPILASQEYYAASSASTFISLVSQLGTLVFFAVFAVNCFMKGKLSGNPYGIILFGVSVIFYICTLSLPAIGTLPDLIDAVLEADIRMLGLNISMLISTISAQMLSNANIILMGVAFWLTEEKTA